MSQLLAKVKSIHTVYLIIAIIHLWLIINVNTQSTDYYDILGVSKDALEQEITKAYKKLALRWHPNVCEYHHYIIQY